MKDFPNDQIVIWYKIPLFIRLYSNFCFAIIHSSCHLHNLNLQLYILISSYSASKMRWEKKKDSIFCFMLKIIYILYIYIFCTLRKKNYKWNTFSLCQLPLMISSTEHMLINIARKTFFMIYKQSTLFTKKGQITSYIQLYTYVW